MAGHSPGCVEEYLEWSKATLGADLSDPRLENLYQTNASNIRSTVSEHSFFAKFASMASEWERAYKERTQTPLFSGPLEPNLTSKPFDSVVEKLFRTNVLWNDRFPEPPPRGWATLDNVYSRLNDIVRGTLVCKFIDGPALCAQRVTAHAGTCSLKSRSYSQERDDGYYAYHLYVAFPVSVFDLTWNVVDVTAEVEIQITTQLQEVLRSLTHHFYATNRLEKDRTGKWKWDFGSTQFKVGYLSHALHLLESVVVESRDRLLGEETSQNG